MDEGATTEAQPTQDRPAELAHRIFGITELLEQILVHLPQGDLLGAQRVCHFWKNTIQTSPDLQRALGMRLTNRSEAEENEARQHRVDRLRRYCEHQDNTSAYWNPLLLPMIDQVLRFDRHRQGLIDDAKIAKLPPTLTRRKPREPGSEGRRKRLFGPVHHIGRLCLSIIFENREQVRHLQSLLGSSWAKMHLIDMRVPVDLFINICEISKRQMWIRKRIRNDRQMAVWRAKASVRVTLRSCTLGDIMSIALKFALNFDTLAPSSLKLTHTTCRPERKCRFPVSLDDLTDEERDSDRFTDDELDLIASQPVYKLKDFHQKYCRCNRWSEKDIEWYRRGHRRYRRF